MARSAQKKTRTPKVAAVKEITKEEALKGILEKFPALDIAVIEKYLKDGVGISGVLQCFEYDTLLEFLNCLERRKQDNQHRRGSSIR